MKKREPVWVDSMRALVFEQPLGKRNYMVGGDVVKPQEVLMAIADLLQEMKDHTKEREHINAEIERLKKFGGVTDSVKQKIEEREAMLKKDFQAYAHSVIDLLARAGITQSDFKITKDLINKSSLPADEKANVKAFIQAAMTLYSLPIVEYTGGRNIKVNEVKQRVTATFGMAEPDKEKTLLAEMGYKKQAVEVGSKLDKGQTTFARKDEGKAKEQVAEVAAEKHHHHRHRQR